MNLLLIDISNTRTKIALADGTVVGKKFSLPTSDLSETYLRDLLAAEKIDDPSSLRFIVSSVVPAKSFLLASALGENLTLIDHRTDLGITIDYPHPAEIGPDRLANAVACAHAFGSPSIAVDFGTAVTFDVIGAGAVYLGGAIAPGLEAMTHYLHHRTALLPELRLERPASAIGKSTIHAMQTGAVIGYRGLVKEILVAIAAEIHPDTDSMPIVATGGNAHLICDEIPQINHFEKNLTLQGLLLIGQRLGLSA